MILLDQTILFVFVTIPIALTVWFLGDVPFCIVSLEQGRKIGFTNPFMVSEAVAPHFSPTGLIAEH